MFSKVSTVITHILVDDKDINIFRVRCTSHGGFSSNMTVTGPDGYSSDLTNNIQPAGNQRWIGNDKYRVTTGDITGGNDGDMYQCTVTSSTSETGIVELRG